jgi:hypothetical protein
MQEENDIPYYSNMLVLSMLCKLYKKNKRLGQLMVAKSLEHLNPMQ